MSTWSLCLLALSLLQIVTGSMAAPVSSRLDTNILSLVQTVAILAALFISAVSFRASARLSRTTAALEIAASHRQLFMEALRDPELVRVFEEGADASSQTITAKQRLFTTLLFIHIYTVYKAHEAKLVPIPTPWYADIAEFASLPVPRAVWADVRRVQDEDFVKFVEQAVRRVTKPGP